MSDVSDRYNFRLMKNLNLFRQTVAEFLDLTLLKDFVYDNIIVGMSIVFFADLTFFTLEPLFLDKKNLSRVNICLCTITHTFLLYICICTQM